MFLQDDEIRRESAGVMGLPEEEEICLETILKGGSDRRFTRVSWAGGSCILMEYGLERQENGYFCGIAAFLEKLGVDTPRILREDAERRLVWLEDLGVQDLWSLREEAWAVRAPLYRSVLEQINVLHEEGWARAQKRALTLMPGFDLEMYAWERGYFYEKFVTLACQVSLSEKLKADLEGLLLGGAEALVGEKPALVHRDFQSQNIMVRHGWTYLIDFQGMRVGTGYYDLASLLYDPYVRFTEAERQELLDFYYSLPGYRPGRERYEELFHFAAMQRLMQALGAYGFLGIEKGRKHFLAHVQPALDHLEKLVSIYPRLGQMAQLVRECRRGFFKREQSKGSA
jgi:N-acetylmuramate 1-kinase